MRALIACTSLLVLSLAGSVSAADPESRIVSITINPANLVSGGSVSVTVETTPDIVNLEVAAGPHRLTIPQVEPGVYYCSAAVPHFPRFIHGRFNVRFFGKTAAGETVGADTTVRLN